MADAGTALFDQAVAPPPKAAPIPAPTPPPIGAPDLGQQNQNQYNAARSQAVQQANTSLFDQAVSQPPAGQAQPGQAAQPGQPPAEGQPAPQVPAGPKPPLLQRIAQGIVGAGKDIGKAALSPVQEIAKPAVAGVMDAGKNVVSGLQSLATWADKSFNLPADQATGGFGQMAGAIQGAEPAPGQTGTSGVVRTISTFLTGFIPAVKGLQALGWAGTAANTAAAFASGATVMNQQKTNLFNLMQEVPVLGKLVPDFLTAKPDDTEAESRLKTGLEAAGMQLVAEGLIGAVKAIKGYIAGSGEAAGAPAGEFSQLGGAKQGGLPERPPLTPEAIGAQPPGETGIDDYAKNVVAAEWSGANTPGNPHYGPVQASDEWWAQFGGGGDRENMKDAIAALGRETDFNTPKLEAALGRAPTNAELYLAHQQGLGGATNLLANPDAPASSIVGEAAVKGNGGTADMTAKQFAQHVEGYFASKAGTPLPGEGGDFAGLGGGKGTTLGAGPQRDWLMVGDPKAPPVTVTAESAKFADDFLAGKVTENPVSVNLAHIEGPDDVKDIIAKVSQALAPKTTQTWEETNMYARALGMSPEDLLKGGQAQTPEYMRAASLVNISSAQQVGTYVDAYMANPTPEAKALAMKALMTQYAIGDVVRGAETNAGRTLNILAQSRGAESDYARAVNNMIQGVGQATEPGELDQLFGRIHDLGNPSNGGDPMKIAEFLGKSAQQNTTKNMITKFWINALVSNPRTVQKKLLSDGLMAIYDNTSRYMAAAYSQTVGSGEVTFAEAWNQTYGYISSIKDAFRLAYKGLTSGESAFQEGFQSHDAMDAVRGGYFKDGAPDIQAMRTAKMAALAEVMPTEITLQNPVKAAGSRLAAFLPTNWLNAVNDLAEYMHYNASRYALGARDAASQGLEGDAFAQHVDNIVQNTPMWVHTQAVDNAQTLAFLGEPGPVASGISKAVNAATWQIPGTSVEIPIGRLIQPFTKIPFNITKMAFQNSLLGVMSKEVQAQIAMGGAARDIQIAKLAVGGMANLAILDAALTGTLTGDGPHDPDLNAAWRRAGNKPNSLMLFGKPYDLHQLEFFGMMMSATANTVETMKFAHDDGRSNLATSLALGWAHALTNTPFMTGFSQWMDAMANPDSMKSQGVIDRTIASMVIPQAGNAVATTLDPWLRMHRGLTADIQSRTPGMSSSLPPLTNLWGDAIPKEDGFYPMLTGTGIARAISPIPVGQPPTNAPAIDKWVWDNRAAFPRVESGKLGLQPPPQVVTYSIQKGISVPVQLTDQQYYRFKVLAGHLLTSGPDGYGAKDRLNTLVMGINPSATLQRQWNNASDAVKALIVQSTVHEYQSAARDQLRREFPDIDAKVRGGAGTRLQELQGAQ